MNSLTFREHVLKNILKTQSHLTQSQYMRTYRMLENGETSWSGQARDAEHAEEKCFADEEPGSLVAYTLQYWSESSQSWVTIYKDARISID
jgi:hypothetical protein